MTTPTACPNGHLPATGAGFCTTCGLAVGAGHDRPVTVLRTACPTGHPVGVGDVYCATCGRATVETTSVTEVREPTATPARTGLRGLAGRQLRPRTVVLVLALVLALSGGAFALAHQVKSSYVDLTGEFESFDWESAYEGCESGYSYVDIEPGASVLVYDEQNRLLGATTLGRGTASPDGNSCTYPFTVQHVRTTAEFYLFEVGNRGKVVVRQEILESRRWFQSMTLGG